MSALLFYTITFTLFTFGRSDMSLQGLLEPNRPRCEEITIPMCRGIGYNLTSMPNELNHETQEEAGLEVHQFWPLVEINCSHDLKFFLCSIYAPICLEEYLKPLKVCRSVCERAKHGCEPIMKQYGFNWPERMNCDLLPVLGEDPENICMDNHAGSGTSDSKPASGTPKATKKPTGLNKCKGKNSKNCKETPSMGAGSTEGVGREACQCRCRPPLIPLLSQNRTTVVGGGVRGAETEAWPREIGGAKTIQEAWSRDNNKEVSIREGMETTKLFQSIGGVSSCAYPCRGAFFANEEREFAAAWVVLWAGLCAACTLMTLTTFLIDTERFKYPERPIVFLSACYFLVASGYLTRVIIGHEAVACDGKILRRDATGPGTCTLVFLLVYFFGMASSIWWVVLSFTWFLAAGLKWGNEAISNYAQYFHLLAWLVPTAQTVAVILANGVEGDPVAGICYVGTTNVDHLKMYVLAPLLVYLLLGTSFLFAGFVSLFRIRSAIKRQGGAGAGSKADKLEKLMIRIGIFSVLYTVPATVVIGCHLYEAANHENWETGLTCPCQPRMRPLYSVVMLKYFMALAVGITSGVWIWSGKTLDSWRRFWRRLCGGSSTIRDPTGAGTALIKPPPPPLGYTPTLNPAPGSVASASHHHLHHHHHMLKQPPLSHV